MGDRDPSMIAPINPLRSGSIHDRSDPSTGDVNPSMTDPVHPRPISVAADSRRHPIRSIIAPTDRARSTIPSRSRGIRRPEIRAANPPGDAPPAVPCPL